MVRKNGTTCGVSTRELMILLRRICVSEHWLTLEYHGYLAGEHSRDLPYTHCYGNIYSVVSKIAVSFVIILFMVQ